MCVCVSDSLAVALTTDHLNEELALLQPILDTSGLPKSHPLYDASKARIPGLLKLEYGSHHILRFAGIRPKCYALDLEAPGQKNVVYKCKGVPRAALTRSTSFEDYKKCIFESIGKEFKFSSIRTDGEHRIYTVSQVRLGLRNFDCKRWIEACGIKTRAFRPIPEGSTAEDIEIQDILMDLMKQNEQVCILFSALVYAHIHPFFY